MLKFLIIVVAGSAFMYYAYKSFDDAFGEDRQRVTGCALDAKVCPNGSVVGRTGPNCAFESCPSQ